MVSAATEVETAELDGELSLGAPIEPKDYRAVLSSSDALLDRTGNRMFPKRFEDGRMQIPDRRARRPLAARNVRVDASYGPFDVHDEGDFDSAMEYWAEHQDCAKASYETLDSMGFDKPIGDKHSLLQRGEIGDVVDGQVQSIDPEVARRMLDTIDFALAEGTPVMLGVDYPGEQAATNSDQVTDHWMVLTGREYDEETGEVRYVGMDNASSKKPVRTFTVGEDFGLRSAAPEGANPAHAYSQPYTATNVRVPEKK